MTNEPTLRRMTAGMSWRVSGALRVLPDFLIIGAQKAGTTSLYEALCRHPDVVAARKKEVRFFDRHWDRGVTWYRWSFPTRASMLQGKHVTGEATPDYLLHPFAPARVAQIVPDIKLLVSFRNPIERCWSQFQMMRRLGLEQRTLDDAIRADIERIESGTGEWDLERYHTSHVERSLYAPQIARWLEHFDRSTFHVTTLERLQQDPRRELAMCWSFLGVHPPIADPHFPHSNRGEGVDIPLESGLRSELASMFADDLALAEQRLGIRLEYEL